MSRATASPCADAAERAPRGLAVLLITFRAGSERYALPARAVHRVLPLPKLRPVPGSAAWLRGVFVCQGALMPVIDLCVLAVGQGCREALSSRIVLVGTRSGGCDLPALALLAEGVTEAVRGDAVELPQTIELPAGRAPAEGWAMIDGEVIQIVAWESLVTAEVLALYATDSALHG